MCPFSPPAFAGYSFRPATEGGLRLSRPGCLPGSAPMGFTRPKTVIHPGTNRATLKPQSNEPLYSNAVIGTSTVDGWTVTFGTARRGLDGLRLPHCIPFLTVRRRTEIIKWYKAQQASLNVPCRVLPPGIILELLSVYS